MYWLSMLGEGFGGVQDEALAVVRLITTIVLSLVGLGVLLVAVWIAFKFVTAVDEQKRKDAKGQMIYAIIGLLVVVVLLVIWEVVVVPAIDSTPDLTNPI